MFVNKAKNTGIATLWRVFLTKLASKRTRLNVSFISEQTLSSLAQKDQLVISTQVIQEYYNVATSKLGLDKLFVKQTLRLLDVYETVVIQPAQILHAIDIQILHQLSFWDSLIISAAKSANCSILLTEDLSDGQMIDGVVIKNPFTLT